MTACTHTHLVSGGPLRICSSCGERFMRPPGPAAPEDGPHLDIQDEHGNIWRLMGPFTVSPPKISYDPEDSVEIETLDLAVEPFSIGDLDER